VSERAGFKGCIQVYTGDGKGKTTAALGLAFRAAGRGLRTYFGQFLKARATGELEAARTLSPLITIEQFGRTGFLHITEEPGDEDTALAESGLRKCREAMLSGAYDIVVLDEVLAAVALKVLSEKEVLDFLEARPESVEIVLTGRSAAPALVDRADLVTEMKPVKHYYSRGIKARDGIER